MNKKDLSERDICTKFITPAIIKSGWDKDSQIREEVSFTAGKVIVRGKLVSRGKGKRADYILYYKNNIPLAVIEAKDGYKLFYDKEKNVIGTEASLQKYFKAVWYATEFSVDSEVNNGRGPVDFKTSFGTDDQTIIEFKLASNSQIKDNLQKQAEIYATANNNPHIIKVILYFTKEEEQRIINILKELHLYENENIILIDARKDNKQSASKVKK